MMISKDKVASFHYTLTNDAGEQLDASPEGQPLSYLHGRNNLIIGLEKALEGKKEGDALEVRVEPEEAYGQHEPDLTQTIPLEAFADVEELQVGMQFQGEDDQGDSVLVTVAEIRDDEVVIDSNHPLAGEALTFKVAISEVREATSEELEQGYALQAE